MPDVPLLLFSQRRRLADLYRSWCRKNHVIERSESFIAFLKINGLLNHQRVIDFLERNKEVETDV